MPTDEPVLVCLTMTLHREAGTLGSGRSHDHRSYDLGAGSLLPFRLLCLPKSNFDEHAWIYWTLDRGRVLAFATRADADDDALYRWWKSLVLFLE